MTEPQWEPINDFPGDQRYDYVPGTKDVSFYGEIGTEHPSGWSWTIIATNDSADQWEPASGKVATEVEAKEAVENWRHSKEDLQP